MQLRDDLCRHKAEKYAVRYIDDEGETTAVVALCMFCINALKAQSAKLIGAVPDDAGLEAGASRRASSSR